VEPVGSSVESKWDFVASGGHMTQIGVMLFLLGGLRPVGLTVEGGCATFGILAEVN